MSAAPLLSVEGIALRYGGLTVLDRINLTVEAGGIAAVIGPNGAGKTSLFNVICGLARPQAGAIALDGARLDGLAPSARAGHGLARTFQNLRLFGEMTALENVLVGAHRHIAGSPTEIVGRFGRFHAAERAAIAQARGLLAFVGLFEAQSRPAKTLSYGDQRRLEIARALALEPKLLLLDEPAAGMNGAETVRLRGLLEAIRARGVAMLLVEHDMSLVMRLCDAITVLNFGRKIAEGPPALVRRDPAVVAAYLGAKAGAALRDDAR